MDSTLSIQLALPAVALTLALELGPGQCRHCHNIPASGARPEVHPCGDKRCDGLLQRTQRQYPQACIENVDVRAGRAFERPMRMSLAPERWVEDGAAILIAGPAGSGRSWRACALRQHACGRVSSERRSP